ncbi:hypothetical protein Tdes44962_MAKER00524 [Teratosphaeria destructans]|uniref:Rhodopsin domain-containing protein n=1 Tax=Teratosphaeria destructans TaxID=418781 RepID=A0A9W7SQA9_9PEZI|nr:hypothetical protein Tdes44962_MAKER00524 [Teratosphaeria destructans]
MPTARETRRTENRFAYYTADDHQAWLWITSVLSLAYASTIAAVRCMVKWKCFGLDDLVLAVAYAVAIAHWSLVYTALSDGLGKTAAAVGPSALAHIGKLVFASRLLLLLVTGLTKCALVLFIRQLFTEDNGRQWRICTAAIGVMSLWTVLSPMIVSIGCRPGQAVDPTLSYCTGDLTRWRFVAAIDFVLEFALLALPAFLFGSVRMHLSKKLTVLMAFAFRLINGLLLVAYLISYTSFKHHGNANIGIVESQTWLEALVSFTLMSATIPVLKSFMGRFKTADLVRIDTAKGSGTGCGDSVGTGAGYALGSLVRSITRASQPEDHDEIALKFAGSGEAVNASRSLGGSHDSDAIEAWVADAQPYAMIHRRTERDVKEGSIT